MQSTINVRHSLTSYIGTAACLGAEQSLLHIASCTRLHMQSRAIMQGS